MTPQPTAALAGHAHTVPPEARHRHGSTCYWELDDCRWQCTTYPRLSYTLDPSTPSARPVLHTGPEARP
jgi:hypothetical protein